MQLGQILVHSGAISAVQLEEALRQQVVYGGRLGTNLIELGYADVDSIAHGLARLHHVPAALARHLDRHDPSVLTLLPPALAAENVLLPVAYSLSGDVKRLVVCMRDPTDREAVGLVRHTAQMEPVVCVASELILYYWLERCYHIKRTRRFATLQPGQATPLPRTTAEQQLADEPDDACPDSIDIDMDEDELDMPSEMQLVELDHTDVERDQRQYLQPSESDLVSLLELVDAKPALAAPAATTAAAVAPASVPRAAAAVREETASPARQFPAAAARPAPPPAAAAPRMTAAEAIDTIAAAERRDQVFDAVLAFMRGELGGGVVFLAKDALALGYMGFGGTFDEATIESLVLPLSVPSVFQEAFERGASFRGPPHAEGGALEERFFKLFPLPAPPTEVIVVPVSIKDRIVCLFYAHAREGGALANHAVERLEELGTATAQAFVRLIKDAKKHRAE